MIEIEEPSEIRIGECAGCMRPLRWMRSWDTGKTFAVVVDAEVRTTFHLHECRPLQEPGTWKALAAVPDPGQADINAAGRAAVAAALAAKDQTRTDNEEQQ